MTEPRRFIHTRIVGGQARQVFDIPDFSPSSSFSSSTLSLSGRGELNPVEFRSSSHLVTTRRLQVRSAFHPRDKFSKPHLTSHEIGWYQSEDDSPFKKKGDFPSRFPRQSSQITKFAENLILGPKHA